MASLQQPHCLRRFQSPTSLAVASVRYRTLPAGIGQNTISAQANSSRWLRGCQLTVEGVSSVSLPATIMGAGDRETRYAPALTGASDAIANRPQHVGPQ